MALFTDLPEEVIVMIVRGLDFSSLYSLYNSCKFFRNILCMQGNVLECNMSRNIVATSNTLNLDFFKTISNHLRVLDMCGVPDLTKTKVLPAFKKLKSLKVLDISYTNLTMTDLIAIHSVCPSLKDITIDFKFSQTSVQIDDKILQQFQTLFEHFENIHFVGSIHNLLCSKVVLQILEKSKLDTLKFSGGALDGNVHTTVVSNVTDYKIPYCSHFAAFLFVNWTSGSIGLDKFPLLSKADLNKYEYCIIFTLQRHRYLAYIYATPLLAKFFKKKFNVDSKSLLDYTGDKKGNSTFMAWNKETTCFDDNFFQKLYTRLNTYFPFNYDPYSGTVCPQHYDWIHTIAKPIEITNQDPEAPTPNRLGQGQEDDDYPEPQDKKRKTSMPNVILDYDNLLKNKSKAQLCITFTQDMIMSTSLPCNGQYFSKITFLSLSGRVKYSADFFSNLFVWCHNLVTLSVEFKFALFRNSYDIVHAIKASKSIKNLRLIDKEMDFKQYFDSLSNCKTLENIHLMDPKQWDHCQIADPTLLVEQCANLYCVLVEGLFTDTALTKQLQMFNKVKIRCRRPHLKVVVNPCPHNCNRNFYDPFVDVFKLSCIKPV